MNILNNFYLPPLTLAGINFASLLPIGIIFMRTSYSFLDCVLIIFACILTVAFIASLIMTYKIEQVNVRPDDVDKIITGELYSVARHPLFTGIICMNVAYLFYFRTLWLIIPVAIFIFLWYLEARYEEKVLIEKFGEEYESYMNVTGMFFPKQFKF